MRADDGALTRADRAERDRKRRASRGSAPDLTEGYSAERTAAAIVATRPGSAIVLTSVILRSATVKDITANGRPRNVTTTPGEPFTSTGRSRAAAQPPPTRACRATAPAPRTTTEPSGCRVPQSDRATTLGWST